MLASGSLVLFNPDISEIPSICYRLWFSNAQAPQLGIVLAFIFQKKKEAQKGSTNCLVLHRQDKQCQDSVEDLVPLFTHRTHAKPQN